jgi:hypothetical protein
VWGRSSRLDGAVKLAALLVEQLFVVEFEFTLKREAFLVRLRIAARNMDRTRFLH